MQEDFELVKFIPANILNGRKVVRYSASHNIAKIDVMSGKRQMIKSPTKLNAQFVLDDGSYLYLDAEKDENGKIIKCIIS